MAVILSPFLVSASLVFAFGTPSAQSANEPAPLLPIEVEGVFGFIDRKGNVVVEPQYDYAGAMVEGMSLVLKGEKFGFVDKAGKLAIPTQYEDAYDFSEGLAAVVVDGKYGYIDKTGKMVIEPRFDPAPDETVCRPFRGGLAALMNAETGKWGFIDKTGKMVIRPQFEWAYDFSDGLAGVEYEVEKYGFINRDGELVLRVDGFFPNGGFTEGLCVIAKGGKNGVIDKTGKWVIEPKYAEIGPFSEGLAWFVEGGKAGFLDKTGRIVIQPTWELDEDYELVPVGDFRSGLAWFREGKGETAREGYIDKTGKIVIPAKFIVAYDFENGIAEVFTEDHKQAYIDTKGNVIWKAK